MNRPIRKAVWFIGLLFIALLANFTVSTVVRTDSLESDPRNRRARDAEFSTNRGDIMVGTTAVAFTEPTDRSDRFQYRRVYSNGPLYAPITGYYSYTFGTSGLEREYGKELSGSADSQLFSRMKNSLSNTPPAGANLHTTINANAQQAAWDALGNKKGAVVALDYTTGAVLAMVSKPSYDPALLSSLDLTASQTAWKQLNDDPNNPMLNRATRDIYPPGSTFKVVTAGAGLKAGKSPQSIIDSPNQLTLPNTATKLGNAGSCGGQQTTLLNALTVSCNTAFALLGMELGADQLRDQAQAFGFNKPIESDIHAVASKFPTELDQPQLAMSSIGQFDVAASPLQMAMVTAAIANNGTMMEPYLVQEIRNPDLSLLSSHRPKKLGNPLSESQATQLQEMMESVVSRGTGRNAKIEGMTIGGKTGTAETSSERFPYAWFIGYAVEPKVAIAVFVAENEEGSSISGGRTSAPIFRKVMEALRP